MRRTKIVCTIGPGSDDEETLSQLIDAGMNVARMNFSHGNHQEHKERIQRVRNLAAQKGKPVAIMLDTKGPEVRTGMLKNDEEVTLKEGEKFVLTTEEIEGDDKRVSVSYNDLPKDVEVGGTILIDDGLIELEIDNISDTEVECTVLNGGQLGLRKGVNLPGVSVNLPAITDKDAADIKFGIELDVDFIAASFIRKASDVLEIKRILEKDDADIKIISKIESEEGVENIDEIIEVSSGIMVARGDLGVEIPTEQVPAAQKMMIDKCNREGKPVITATQMLDSMIRNPRPTRAEASDVANAILDGTDATMLSGETAMGEYPVRSVETMAKIAQEIEESEQYAKQMAQKNMVPPRTVTDSISYSTCETAHDLGASAIITSTSSGHTARMVSKYRPYSPVIAATPNPKVCKQLALSWGVKPIVVEDTASTDDMFEVSVRGALEAGYINMGDLIVLTAGTPVGVSGTTNLLRVHIVGEAIVRGTGIGKTAFSGRVCIVDDPDEANEKMKEGDVLVTHSTDRDFVPAMKKAEAVITEEAGLTSHAAIVSLNLGIPAVVGAYDAMEMLEDGELVTVDSVRGLVYKGEANVL
ncbi:pyruvate kinase [Acetohalobium arabaticum]|uniref:Pyruvate kinase n=1 Tax=Acetohalobium arabaticum (strain ATCC 49924 / DSM 5501 / Z-7288) TaxID=574087 RepID=D9QS72_ACEAZ|nr:pyruvate kinase [Acetohalobium arabaticum]ADL13363.1 pyruvate kinase [Acetohalobium arabaticum DSM 5501]